MDARPVGFGEVLAGPGDLRDRYPRPAEPALRKEIDHLDRHCRDFIAHAPLVIISTADGGGRCDASPKGGPPGFVVALDEHRLAVPDLPGNNRLDSLSNLVDNPHLALLFLIPGLDETLRVNGRACITTDEAILDACAVRDRRPKAAIGVEVDSALPPLRQGAETGGGVAAGRVAGSVGPGHAGVHVERPHGRARPDPIGRRSGAGRQLRQPVVDVTGRDR